MAKLTRSLDGCPLDMKDRVKESMNDPDSFECIETNVIRRKDDYVMIMQFRGKNQLGEWLKMSPRRNMTQREISQGSSIKNNGRFTLPFQSSLSLCNLHHG